MQWEKFCHQYMFILDASQSKATIKIWKTLQFGNFSNYKWSRNYLSFPSYFRIHLPCGLTDWLRFSFFFVLFLNVFWSVHCSRWGLPQCFFSTASLATAKKYTSLFKVLPRWRTSKYEILFGRTRCFRIIIIIILLSGDDNVLSSNEPAVSSWFCVFKRHLYISNCRFGLWST